MDHLANSSRDVIQQLREDSSTHSDDQLTTFVNDVGIEQFSADDDVVADPRFLSYFEIAFAREQRVLGLAANDHSCRVLFCDWNGWKHLDTVRRVLKCDAVPVFTTREILDNAIDLAFENRSGQTQQLIDTLDETLIINEADSGFGLSGRSNVNAVHDEDLLDSDGRAPIIRLVNSILFEAVKSGASDVHIQPYENRVVVRQRIDGVLFDSFDIPKAVQEEVLTRIKVLGRMNIAEKRLPQDGRATVQVGPRVVDLRIASLPTSHNERIVIRLLDKSARLYTLGELGMPEAELLQFRQLIRRDHGLILVTGPTGSGKSTTLYAALQEINTTGLNVLTLEDPIEYQLDGISQTQINEKKGMTFASGLRNVLRQDPDIIMVGEIRDQETAMMAIQASLTGHLVFSTLHTNDASSAVTRLLDLGIEPYLVASSLVASLAQRLVRKLCDNCKSPASVTDSVYNANGCDACRSTGYKGRLGLFELLVVDEPIRDAIQRRANAAEIRETALAAGMELLNNDGHTKVQAGVTTVAEVLRVAGGFRETEPNVSS